MPVNLSLFRRQLLHSSPFSKNFFQLFLLSFHTFATLYIFGTSEANMCEKEEEREGEREGGEKGKCVWERVKGSERG